MFKSVLFITFILCVANVSGSYTSCYTTPTQSVTFPKYLFRNVNYVELCNDYQTNPEEWSVEKKDRHETGNVDWNVDCVDGFKRVQTHTQSRFGITGLCNTCKSVMCDIQHVCCKPIIYKYIKK